MPHSDRRIYERRTVNSTVRFISEKDLEAQGRLIDISEGGLAMTTDAKAEIGDSIIAYPEGLGRLTGVVRRKTEDGLALEFEISDSQRTHLSRRIESVLSGIPYLRLLENRSAKRMDLNLVSEARHGQTGRSFVCEIMNISDTGALIKTEERPALGATIHIGSITGIVRRHTRSGIGLEFTKLEAPQAACA